MFHHDFKRLLDAKGLNANQFADAMRDRGHDVSTSAVYEWIRGSRLPSYDSTRAIIDTLECSAAEFLGMATDEH